MERIKVKVKVLFITQSLIEVTVLKAMLFKNFDKVFLCFALLYSEITVIQGIPNHWEFRVSPRNLLKKIKQSMHFVNLNFVL